MRLSRHDGHLPGFVSLSSSKVNPHDRHRAGTTTMRWPAARAERIMWRSASSTSARGSRSSRARRETDRGSVESTSSSCLRSVTRPMIRRSTQSPQNPRIPQNQKVICELCVFYVQPRRVTTSLACRGGSGGPAGSTQDDRARCRRSAPLSAPRRCSARCRRRTALRMSTRAGGRCRYKLRR